MGAGPPGTGWRGGWRAPACVAQDGFAERTQDAALWGDAAGSHSAVPEVFAHARFVYVEGMDGGEFDRNLNPEDRMAIADVRDFLKKWGRYTISYERDKAELIFVVRKGRLAEADADVGISNGQDP